MGKPKRYYEKQENKSKQGKVQNGKIKKGHTEPVGKKVITYNISKSQKTLKKNDELRNKLVKKVFKANPNPKFPGRAPVDQSVKEKHTRGEGTSEKAIKYKIHKVKLKQKEKAIEFAEDQAARTEILLTEDAGVLEADAGETTTQFRQGEIAANVDITAATKHFELHLREFGPYRMGYTRNGRHLLLGGRKGHVAAMDWITKKLHCEINVMESIHDVCWLHYETMFAVAQKKWVYIYDNQGIELHCLKKLNRVTKMTFLPYHFLLATASDEGYLSWLDISIGQMVTQTNSRLGRLSLMCQNPTNAVLCVGNTKGVVSMWTPNVRDPVAKMLCHKTALTALHVDPLGNYMATSAADRTLRIWDIRKLAGPVKKYVLRSSAHDLNFSYKGLLAVGLGNIVEVYKNPTSDETKYAYLRHVMNNTIGNFQFCPHEDVLGVATEKGFTSLLVPGAGEANFDALEVNPYQTKQQRREAEVKALLEKIPYDLINLDQGVIAQVDVPTLKDKIEAKKQLLYIKPPKIDYTSRKKSASSVHAAKTKKIVQETAKRDFIKEMKTQGIVSEQQALQGKKKKSVKKSDNVLDRFL